MQHKCSQSRGRKYRVSGRPYFQNKSRRKRASSIRKIKAVLNAVSTI